MIYSCYIAENYDFVLIFNCRINNLEQMILFILLY
jgi:hypothetical protein